MAQPGKPDVECKISPELLSQIDAIALGGRQGRTTAARLVWKAGVVVITSRATGSGLTGIVGEVAKLLPEFEDVPLGSKLLKFNVLDKDLERLKAIAQLQDKKTAQLHRNALAIGIWVYAQIAIVMAAVDEAQPE